MAVGEKSAESSEAREDRFRVMLGVISATIILLALACCCTGSALLHATDDGHQSTYRGPRVSH